MQCFVANDISAVTHRTTLWCILARVGHLNVSPFDDGLGRYVMRGDDDASPVSIATRE